MDLSAVAPELVVGAILLLLPAIAGWARGAWRALPMALVLLALVAAMALSAQLLGRSPTTAFCGTYAVDPLRGVFQLLIETGALLSALLCASHFAGADHAPQAPMLLLFTTLGAMALVAVDDLGLIVLAIQFMSFGGYLLVALVRTDRRAQEGALKYFLFGASALAIMAYGLTLLYGLTGSLALPAIGNALHGADRLWVALALALVMVGFAFEITAVPFHLWAPDAFQGATAPVAGFLSVVPKIAALGALIRLLQIAIPIDVIPWNIGIAILAAVTMTLGNLVALRQTSLKRLLAYSSIAQAGYLLMGVAALPGGTGALTAVDYYLAAYLLMNLTAFGAVAMLERRFGHDGDGVLESLGRRAPWTALALTLALLSLAGIPPLAGFAGKVLLLSAALDARLTWLALLAAANMVVGLVYYVRLIARMYFGDASDDPPPRTGLGYHAVLALGSVGTVILGIAPSLIIGPIAS